MSTFTAHVSRKHSEVNLIDSVALPHGMNECTEQHLESHRIFFAVILMVWNKTPLVKVWMKVSFLRHLALFYLKLQSKCLIPSSTIQIIVERLQEIHEMSHSHLPFKLRALEFSEADINSIFEI